MPFACAAGANLRRANLWVKRKCAVCKTALQVCKIRIAQALQRQLSTAPAVDNARVQAVREALENGSYRINPEAIAQRMLDMDNSLYA